MSGNKINKGYKTDMSKLNLKQNDINFTSKIKEQPTYTDHP
jgi:hypothetical protein